LATFGFSTHMEFAKGCQNSRRQPRLVRLPGILILTAQCNPDQDHLSVDPDPDCPYAKCGQDQNPELWLRGSVVVSLYDPDRPNALLTTCP